MDAEESPVGRGFRNEGEARSIVRIVEAFLTGGLLPSRLCIISPYTSQCALLRTLLSEIPSLRTCADDLEVSTVNSFQGRDKDIVILSTVRTSLRSDATSSTRGTLPKNVSKCLMCQRYFTSFVYTLARTSPSFCPTSATRLPNLPSQWLRRF